jgi:hypothetical protein
MAAMRPVLTAILLALSLGACSKCDVPIYGFGGWFAPAACTETPRRP